MHGKISKMKYLWNILNSFFFLNKKNSKAIELQRLRFLIAEFRNYPIGYMSCLFHKKHEFVLTHPKSHSSIVHTTQLMPATLSWQAPQSNLWFIVRGRSVTLNTVSWQAPQSNLLFIVHGRSVTLNRAW